MRKILQKGVLVIVLGAGFLGFQKAAAQNSINESFTSTVTFCGNSNTCQWYGEQWNVGAGTATQDNTNGTLTLDGYHIVSNTYFGVGSSLTVRAIFTAGSLYENIGFSSYALSPQYNEPFATIGRGGNPSANGVYARLQAIGDQTPQEVFLGDFADGSYYDFTITRTSQNTFEYYVDGTLITTLTSSAFNMPFAMVINISDYSTSGATLVLDSIVASYAALPVSFTSLTASAVGTAVKLAWSTISESNNKGFEIYRSPDGVKWANLGFVSGAGNSSVKNNYSYTDKDLVAGTYYYRLNQVDLDGKSALTNVVKVNLAGQNNFSLNQSYPNPMRGSSVISYSVPQQTKVRITIYDVSGKVIKVAEDAIRQKGNYNLMVDASRMNSGVYYYKMEAGSFTATRKMIIQN